jgi:hypothetical protein
MFAHEIAKDPSQIQPRWLRVPAACVYSGLPRSSLYRLLAQNIIKSASLCNVGKARGTRLIDRFELDALLSDLTRQNAAATLEQPPVEPARRKTASVRRKTEARK